MAGANAPWGVWVSIGIDVFVNMPELTRNSRQLFGPHAHTHTQIKTLSYNHFLDVEQDTVTRDCASSRSVLYSSVNCFRFRKETHTHTHTHALCKCRTHPNTPTRKTNEQQSQRHSSIVGAMTMTTLTTTARRRQATNNTYTQTQPLGWRTHRIMHLRFDGVGLCMDCVLNSIFRRQARCSAINDHSQ